MISLVPTALRGIPKVSTALYDISQNPVALCDLSQVLARGSRGYSTEQ
jgi:hypothetical protein